MTLPNAAAPSLPFLIICTPMRDQPTAEYRWSLDHAVEFYHVRLSVIGKPVDQARNELARQALEVCQHTKADGYDLRFYVTWIDDDAAWSPRARSGT